MAEPPLDLLLELELELELGRVVQLGELIFKTSNNP
jgi:hypothetical protein